MPTIRTRQITSFLALQKYSHRRKHSHAGNLSHLSAHKSKREPARNPESLGAGREGMNELGGGGGTGVSGGGRCSTGARKCVGESGASSSASEKNTKQRSAQEARCLFFALSLAHTHIHTREPFSLLSSLVASPSSSSPPRLPSCCSLATLACCCSLRFLSLSVALSLLLVVRTRHTSSSSLTHVYLRRVACLGRDDSYSLASESQDWNNQWRQRCNLH